eukprot:6055493-Amphidinium_carterae.1
MCVCAHLQFTVLWPYKQELQGAVELSRPCRHTTHVEHAVALSQNSKRHVPLNLLRSVVFDIVSSCQLIIYAMNNALAPDSKAMITVGCNMCFRLASSVVKLVLGRHKVAAGKSSTVHSVPIPHQSDIPRYNVWNHNAILCSLGMLSHHAPKCKTTYQGSAAIANH